MGCKIIVDGDCSHEIKRRLLLGRKAMTNLDSTVKSKDIPLLIKVHIVKIMVFPVVMHGCESWTIKKTVIKNWCLQIVMLDNAPESPLDNKEIKPVNLKGNQPWILTGRTTAIAPILWLPDANSQLVRKDPAWCWERLRAGGEEGTRRWDGWMASLTQWTWVWTDSRKEWRPGKPGVLGVHGVTKIRHF